METEQFNIRITKNLMRDLKIVSALLKISKSDWVKIKLAEKINEEKNRLLMELSTLYAKGMIGKRKIEKLVGKDIAEEMKHIKKKSELSIKEGSEYGRKLKK